MKRNRYLVPAGLLLFLALCLVPVGQAQQAQPVNQAAGQPWQLGLSWTFTATSTPTSAIPVKGLTYWRLLYVPSGTVSACSLSFDSSALGVSYSTGGILTAGSIGSCAGANMFVTSAASVPTNFGQLTPTITGSGSVTVVLFGYTDNPAAGGSIGGSVAVTNFPATHAVSAASLPLPAGAATSAKQPAIGTAGTASIDVLTVQGKSGMTPVTVDGSAVTQPTQPAGFGSILAGQQAVTASAVALPTNTTHGVCVKALIGNTINVYVGSGSVTTATGVELAPDESVCYQISNSNLLSVIASTTGASVSWTAQ